MIWCLLCCCTFGATQFSSLEFGAIILNTHLATKKNVQKIQVFLLLDLVTFLLIGEQHLSFLYYLICREERSFCASCPSGVPSCTRLLGHQLGLGLMRNPLASPCCNPTLSHSRAAGGEVQLGDRTWGERGRNTCVGLGQLAGIPIPTATGSPVIEDILEGQSLYSTAQEVAQLKNSFNIIVGVTVRRPK